MSFLKRRNPFCTKKKTRKENHIFHKIRKLKISTRRKFNINEKKLQSITFKIEAHKPM